MFRLTQVLIIGCFLFFSHAVNAEGVGEKSSQVGFGSIELRLPDGSVVEIGDSTSTSTREWVPFGENITGENLRKAFEMQGVLSEVLNELNLVESVEYDLYLTRSEVGEIEYLVIPVGEEGQPVQISQPAQISRSGGGYYGSLSGPEAQLVFLSWNPLTKSAEEIREEIISAIEATLDELCGMRAKPQQIRAQVSAIGIIEFEATWIASEICG